ncbi:hypothetical protein N0V90_012787 [Kalmusia sp. IMI 367209]|nr:hypothetical protein N0V90_012787 [Kalmusia sp. IMI 367209]
MAPSLKPSAAATLRNYIEATTTGEKPTLPGAILQILDAHGNTLFSHASEPHTTDTLITIHSCSKIIGAIAFMQLVDCGLVSLDDASIIEKWLPELAAKKVLTGSKQGADGKKEWLFEDREGEITPRMLLNHTNGTGMSFFHADLREYLDEGWDARNEGQDYFTTLLESPLLWQPGTKTNYSQGFEWLSVLIERLTKRSLEDVLREEIFEKLGDKRTGFRGEMGGSVVAGEGVDFWPQNLRLEDGFMAIPGFAEKKVEREDAWPTGKHHVQTVGTGLVSSVADMAHIFSILLPQNAGVDPISGTRILSASSAAEITRAQLPERIQNDTRNLPSAYPLFIPSEVQAQHVDPAGSFGLGCAIQGADRVLKDGKRGRSKGTVYWYGVSNSAYWVDGEKGLVVVMAGNFFPFEDPKWTEFVAGVEGLLYEGLEE